MQVPLSACPRQRTFAALRKALCTELELLPTQELALVRRLPNVLVRKDADVRRLRAEDYLEVEVRASVSF